jgi:hypothetical protein
MIQIHYGAGAGCEETQNGLTERPISVAQQNLGSAAIVAGKEEVSLSISVKVADS